MKFEESRESEPMRTLTVRLPDDALDRLRQLARDRGISVSHTRTELYPYR